MTFIDESFVSVIFVLKHVDGIIIYVLYSPGYRLQKCVQLLEKFLISNRLGDVVSSECITPQTSGDRLNITSGEIFFKIFFYCYICH